MGLSRATDLSIQPTEEEMQTMEVVSAGGTHVVDLFLDLVVEFGKIVKIVMIHGKLAVDKEQFLPESGRESGYGSFIPAR